MATQTTTSTPRVYIACLAAYNAGKLHGAWFAVDADLWDNIQSVIESSPEPDAEEWAIHDFEGFGSFPVSESQDIDTLILAAELIEEHGTIIMDYAAHIGADIDGSLSESFEDAYCGQTSELDYAYQLIDECYDLEKMMGNLASYFDYESFTRDLFMSDYFSLEDADGNTHIFRNN